MSRPSTRAAVRSSPEANAKVRTWEQLALAPIDKPLHARPSEVRALVRHIQAQEQATFLPAWLHCAREVTT